MPDPSDELIHILHTTAGMEEKTDFIPDRCERPQRLAQEDQRQNSEWVKKYVIEKMHYHEKEKYPEPPWQYQRLEIDDEQKGEKKKTIVHIQYDPNAQQDDPEKILATQAAHAVALRKLSIIGGLLTGLEANGFLEITDDKAKKWLIERLYQIAAKINAEDLKGRKAKDIMNEFANDLTDIIARSGVTEYPAKKIARELAYPKGAEVWFIGEYNSNQILVAESKNAEGHAEYQIDVPLQLEQKEAIPSINIEADEQPIWFRNRPEWEKTWLRAHPETLANDFRPAGQMHTPGTSNARMHYYYIGNNPVSRSVKSGILNAYNVASSWYDFGKERRRLTKQNARQMLDQMKGTLEKETADARPLPNGMKKLIFVQSLVSGGIFHVLDFSGEKRMADEEIAAIQEVKAEYTQEGVDIEILANNSPVNGTRHLPLASPGSGKIHPSNNEYDDLITYADKFLKALDTAGNNMNFDKPLIEAALQNLMEMQAQGPKRDDRNFNLMRAATAAILVEAMGGISLTHCKSGKDRTGLEEMERLAMLKCWQESDPINRSLPSYYDNDDQRETFIQACVELFETKKIYETASESAPGSFGIKDKDSADRGILCGDVRDAIEGYDTHCHLGRTNKPKAKNLNDTLEEKFHYENGIGSLQPFQVNEYKPNPEHPLGMKISISTGRFKEPLKLEITEKLTADSKLEFLIKHDQPCSNLANNKLNKVAKEIVEKYFNRNPRSRQDGIEIFGALDPALSRRIEAYCQIQKIPYTNNNTLDNAKATPADRDSMKSFLDSAPRANTLETRGMRP